MKRRSNLLARSILAVLWTYAVLGGATGNGLLTPQYTFMTLAFMALIIVGWLLLRWRGGWVWHRTPLDGAFVLWGAAIVVSTLANPDGWPRISIGIWFALAYVGLWYVLHDLIANRALDRAVLLESLLIAGAVAMVFGYAQVVALLIGNGASLASILETYRPAGTLGNPNTLAALLVVVIPLAISRWCITSRGGKLLLGAYLVLACLLLAFTFSRGGWLGALVGLIVWVALTLAHFNMLSRARLALWWEQQSVIRRAILAGLAGLIALGVAGAGLIVVRSFSSSGRSADLRTYIYDAAIQMIVEKPLTGHGLFTFGRGLLRLASTPPLTPHAHAHDIPLNVTAELGLIGLLALVVTIWRCLQTMRHNWLTSKGPSRMLLAGAIAGIVSLFIHHLLDMPLIGSPLIALVGICTLVVATAPAQPLPAPDWQRRAQPVLMAGVWIFLLISGFWSASNNRDYVAAMQYGTASQDFRGASQRLQAVISAAPSMPVYYLYDGYFLAMAAQQGDPSALPEAIAAYRRFCDLEPYYAPAWANLAALYWQSNQREQAVPAMAQAVQLAPQAWNLQFNLGLYYETVGNMAGARQAYREVLTLNPDAALLPEWQQTDLRRQIVGENDKLSPLAHTVLLLDSGKIIDAEQVWKPASTGLPTIDHIVAELFALAIGDRKTAADEVAAAKRTATDLQSGAWLHLGMARLASFDHDETTARQERDMARKLLEASPAALDDRIPALTYTQFWRIGLPQYFLPQVYAPPADTPLLLLLGSDHS